MQWVSRIVVLALAGSLVSNAPLAEADYYVAQNGQTPGDFLSWGTAASNIQEAVDAASAGDTIWVGAGTYTAPPSPTVYMGTNVVYIDKPLTLRSSNGVPESVIIDGGGAYRGIVFTYNLSSSFKMVLDGLTIYNCTAPGYGGGIFYYLTGGGAGQAITGEVRNCIIASNSVCTTINTDSGGGLRLVSASASAASYFFLVTNCVIRGNWLNNSGTIGGNGGGLSSGGKSLAHSCRFENNSAVTAGGGAVGVGTYAYCVFSGNDARRATGGTSGGGGVYGGGTFTNCLMYNNWAAQKGGFGYSEKAAHRWYFYNCTIVSNQSGTSSGGGVNVEAAAILTCENTLFVSNRYAGGMSDISRPASSTNYISYSYFRTNTINETALIIGEGNITNSVDPQFADFGIQDFRLTANSPCVNTGTNQAWMIGALDLDDNPRISPAAGGTVDMGAFEFQVPPLNSGAVFSIR